MSDKRYFQYLAGTRQGEVVIFDKIEEDDGMVFVAFKDKSRVNEELIQPIEERKYTNKFMAEIEGPSNPWTFEEKWVGRQEEKFAKDGSGNSVVVEPFIEGKKRITPLPPRPPHKTSSSFGMIEEKPVQKVAPVEEKLDLSDPVFLMMDKSKKTDISVDMNLVLSLPSKSLYNVAKESFDNGSEKTIEYIIKSIKKEQFEESLRQALLQAYEDNDKPEEVKETENSEELKINLL